MPFRKWVSPGMTLRVRDSAESHTSRASLAGIFTCSWFWTVLPPCVTGLVVWWKHSTERPGKPYKQPPVVSTSRHNGSRFFKTSRYASHIVLRHLTLALIFLHPVVFMVLSPRSADGGAINSFVPGAVNPNVAGNPVMAPPMTKTVRPVEISDVLYNPGMGVADFQFGWGSGKPLPTPEEYPPRPSPIFDGPGTCLSHPRVDTTSIWWIT